MVAVDESAVRWQGRSQQWHGLPRKPIGVGVKIHTVLSLYNHSYNSVYWHAALVLPQHQGLAEDVLR